VTTLTVEMPALTLDGWYGELERLIGVEPLAEKVELRELKPAPGAFGAFKVPRFSALLKPLGVAGDLAGIVALVVAFAVPPGGGGGGSADLTLQSSKEKIELHVASSAQASTPEFVDAVKAFIEANEGEQINVQVRPAADLPGG